MSKLFRIKGGKYNLAKTAVNACSGVIVYKDGNWALDNCRNFNYSPSDIAFTLSFDDTRGTYSEYMYKLGLKISKLQVN